jgi:pyruvate,water dikinase
VARHWVRTLDEVGAADVALVGGKGANLGELVGAGIPVPVAFCVTTGAYRRFMEQNGLTEPVAEYLATIDYDDPVAVGASAGAIRALLVSAPIPDEVATEVTAAYQELEEQLVAEVAVAVRSSATAEDLPGASFAGQQETYLSLVGPAAVLEGIRRCWSSLWTDRAISYRHRQGFDHLGVAVAVVVQEMFPATVSGVLFTANPVTSNPDQFFLNASWGLGEAVVAGRVNPDQLVVAKPSLAVVTREIADKAVMTVTNPSGRGASDVAVPEARRRLPALRDPEIAELCRLAQRIEDHYGFPQDVEWGLADGRFAILQAREVTGADLDLSRGLELWKTPTARAVMYDERWTWSRAYSDEVQTGPSTPSFYTYLQLGMTRLKATALALTGTTSFLGYEPEQLLDFPFFRWYGARAYYNLAFERERIRRFIPPFARDEAALWPFPEAERDEIKALPFDWEAFFELLRHLHHTNHDVSLLGTTAVVYEGLERWTDAENEFWQGVDLEQLSVEEIFAAQAASRTGSRFGENVVLPFTIYLFMLPQALQTTCRQWLDDHDGRIYNRLVGGLQTKTGEENVAVWELSRAVRASPRVLELLATQPNATVLAELAGDTAGRALLAQLDVFIARYGHRGGAERDAYHRRWRHDPSLVFDAVRPLLALDDHESPAAHEARQRAQMLATRQECVARLRGVPVDAGAVHEMGWLEELHSLTGAQPADRAELFIWLVEVVQDYFYYRDFERFFNDRTMSRSRDLYEAIGRRFLAKGLLEDPDDVFFLGRDEMLAADRSELSRREVEVRVRARRRVYATYSYREPPKYLRGWTAFDDEVRDDDGALRGIAASTGRVTGRARVCRHLAEIARLERGDILVTVATDPGWTTVFSMIGGVVVETGGVVAHAVMISREYGLPCVANLTQACDRIPDGALVTVDGTSGRVWVEPAVPS